MPSQQYCCLCEIPWGLWPSLLLPQLLLLEASASLPLLLRLTLSLLHLLPQPLLLVMNHAAPCGPETSGCLD
jgi:hypothetical protein